MKGIIDEVIARVFSVEVHPPPTKTTTGTKRTDMIICDAGGDSDCDGDDDGIYVFEDSRWRWRSTCELCV
jgi:hypothetical protein